MDECLYDYYIHDKQDHNKFKDKTKLKKKSTEIRKMLITTIKSLNIPEEKEVLKMVEERIIRTETVIAFQYNDKDWFMEEYRKMKKENRDMKDVFRYIIIKYPMLYSVFHKHKEKNRKKHCDLLDCKKDEV